MKIGFLCALTIHAQIVFCVCPPYKSVLVHSSVRFYACDITRQGHEHFENRFMSLKHLPNISLKLMSGLNWLEGVNLLCSQTHTVSSYLTATWPNWSRPLVVISECRVGHIVLKSQTGQPHFWVMWGIQSDDSTWRNKLLLQPLEQSVFVNITMAYRNVTHAADTSC